MLKKNVRPPRGRERIDLKGKAVSNKILLALPDDEYNAIRPELEFLKLPHHCVLYEPNRNIEFVYFPNRGLVSLVVAMEDSKTVEVGLMGSEGFAGGAAMFGLTRSPIREVVQVAGEGFRVRVATLRQSLSVSRQLEVSLGRYLMVLGMQISQTAACNRLHDIQQRLARWLLMAQDRVDSHLVAITHDFLATMLGTDRPTVSTAAAALQRRQMIRYNRGSVEILNRKKLEGAVCECYRVIQQFNGEIDLR